MPRKTTSSAKKTSNRKSAGSPKKRTSSSTKSSASRALKSSASASKSKSAGSKRGGRSRSEDRSKINVHQPHELRYWTKTLGVTATRLKDLVTEHGPSVAGIRRRLTSSAKRSRSTDRSRINVHQPYELRYWTKALNVTGDRLKQLVNEYGPSASGIRRALGLTSKA